MNKHSQQQTDKAARQQAILDIVGRQDMATQNDLVAALRKKRIAATQVSVSRDIAELGLVKLGGYYKPAGGPSGPADPELPLRAWMRAVLPAGPHMTVVRTDVGMAQSVGLVIDGLGFEGFVGSIAGDDTVFVAVRDAAAQKRVLDYLNARINK
jgi:transcriptional regulator of arginine metabolism